MTANGCQQRGQFYLRSREFYSEAHVTPAQKVHRRRVGSLSETGQHDLMFPHGQLVKGHQYFNDILHSVKNLNHGDYQKLDSFFSSAKYRCTPNWEVKDASEPNVEDEYLNFAAEPLTDLITSLKDELTLEERDSDEEGYRSVRDTQNLLVTLEQKLLELLKKVHSSRTKNEMLCSSNSFKSVPKFISEKLPENPMCKSRLIALNRQRRPTYGKQSQNNKNHSYCLKKNSKETFTKNNFMAEGQNEHPLMYFNKRMFKKTNKNRTVIGQKHMVVNLKNINSLLPRDSEHFKDRYNRFQLLSRKDVSDFEEPCCTHKNKQNSICNISRPKKEIRFNRTWESLPVAKEKFIPAMRKRRRRKRAGKDTFKDEPTMSLIYPDNRLVGNLFFKPNESYVNMSSRNYENIDNAENEKVLVFRKLDNRELGNDQKGESRYYIAPSVHVYSEYSEDDTTSQLSFAIEAKDNDITKIPSNSYSKKNRSIQNPKPSNVQRRNYSSEIVTEARKNGNKKYLGGNQHTYYSLSRTPRKGRSPFRVRKSSHRRKIRNNSRQGKRNNRRNPKKVYDVKSNFNIYSSKPNKQYIRNKGSQQPKHRRGQMNVRTNRSGYFVKSNKPYEKIFHRNYENIDDTKNKRVLVFQKIDTIEDPNVSYSYSHDILLNRGHSKHEHIKVGHRPNNQHSCSLLKSNAGNCFIGSRNASGVYHPLQLDELDTQGCGFIRNLYHRQTHKKCYEPIQFPCELQQCNGTQCQNDCKVCYHMNSYEEVMPDFKLYTTSIQKRNLNSIRIRSRSFVESDSTYLSLRPRVAKNKIKRHQLNPITKLSAESIYETIIYETGSSSQDFEIVGPNNSQSSFEYLYSKGNVGKMAKRKSILKHNSYIPTVKYASKSVSKDSMRLRTAKKQVSDTGSSLTSVNSYFHSKANRQLRRSKASLRSIYESGTTRSSDEKLVNYTNSYSGKRKVRKSYSSKRDAQSESEKRLFFRNFPPEEELQRSKFRRRRRKIKVGSEQFTESIERVIEYDFSEPEKPEPMQPNIKETYSRGTSTEVLPFLAKRTSTTDLIKLIKAIGINTDKASTKEQGIDPMPQKQKTPPPLVELISKFTNTEKLNLRSTGTDAIPISPKPAMVSTANDPLFHVVQRNKETNTAPGKKKDTKSTGTDPKPIQKVEQSNVATDPLYYLGQKVKFTNTEQVVKADAQTATAPKAINASKGTATTPTSYMDKKTSYDKVKTTDQGNDPVHKQMVDKGLQFNTYEKKPPVKTAFTETETKKQSVKVTQTSFTETKEKKPSFYDIETQTTLVKPKPPTILPPPIIRPPKKEKSDESVVDEPEEPKPVCEEPSQLSMHLIVEKCHEDIYKRCNNSCKQKCAGRNNRQKIIVCENKISSEIKINASDCKISYGTEGKFIPAVDMQLNVSNPKNPLSTLNYSSQKDDKNATNSSNTKKTKLSAACGMDIYNVKNKNESQKSFPINEIDTSDITLTSQDWQNIAAQFKYSSS